MKIDKNKKICGQPFPIVRDMLKLFSGGSYSLNNCDYFYEVGLSIAETHKLILALYNEGYIQKENRDSNTCYTWEQTFPYDLEATETGRRIAMAKLSPRMKRKTVEKLLRTVLDRAAETKSLPFLRFQVSRIHVFGSFLDSELEDYGDIDLVVETSMKDEFEGSDEFSSEELALPLFGIEPLKSSEEWERLSSNIDRRISMAIDCKKNGLINYQPKKPGMYDWMGWDFGTTEFHLKRRNHRIGIHEIRELMCLKTEDVLLVYDESKGGIIEPIKMTKNEAFRAV